MDNTYTYKRYLIGFLFAICLPMFAQTDDKISEDKNEAIDTILVEEDSLAKDSLALPWPRSAQYKIDKLLKSDMFKTSQLGLMVYDLDADSAIYCYKERQTMRPASTMKLITAIAALDKLGGGYKFKTDLCYTGRIDSCTLVGDVYCVGGFDPIFNNDDLNAFVESIKKMGVDTIRGHIYADRSMKNSDLLGEGWCWDDDNPTLSPLLLGRKDRFMERFERELREAGIVVDAFVSTNTKPDDAFCIAQRFHTMDQVLMRMLKRSDNLYAESMFYQIAASTGAHPASAKNARAVINRLIKKIGLNPARYKIADGSGLSLYNYVTAELEVKLLRYAYMNGNIYNHLYPALPIAGTDGTIDDRMRGAFTRGNVHAKTGTVTGISSLAGYCKAANGHTLCFAIINQGVMHRSNARRFQDKVCEILCSPQ